MSWYLSVLKKYAVFSGRARRMEYWYFLLFNVIFTVALVFVDAALGTFSEEAGLGLLSGIYTLAVFLPSLAVTIRRLHDSGRTGWWVLIALIPLLGLVILVFMMLPSEPGTNKYGPNPIESPAAA